MKSIRLSRIFLICMLLVGSMILFTGCGGGKPAATSAPTETLPPVTETTVPTPTLSVFEGSLPSNSEAVTWTAVETKLEAPAKMTVDLKDGGFLKVRTGPDKTYRAVASLTNGMTVTVVAKTSTGWYKLDNGYYSSADYLKSAA